MSPTRTVRSSLVLAALLSLLGGCGPPEPTGGPKKDEKTPAPSAKPGPTPAPTGTPVVPLPDTGAAKASAGKFAGEFLKGVNAKTATPAQLSVEFKKVVAPPVRAEDAERRYSDDAADTWLKRLAGEVADAKVTCDAAAADAAFAVGSGGAGGRTLLRLAKSGDAWVVDWLSVAPAGVTEPATLAGDDAPAQFAAAAFLDAACRQLTPQATALLSDAAQRKYGEDVFDKTKVSQATLKSSLEKLFGGATAHKLTTTAKDGPAVKFLAELTAAGGTKAATLRVVRGTRPGEWLVDDIEVK